MGPQELEAGNTLDSHPVDVDGVVRALVLLPEVHDELPGFACVKELVIVGAPHGQVLYLFPVCCLIVVTDETNHCCVVCKFDDGVGSTYRPAVMGEEGIQEWA